LKVFSRASWISPEFLWATSVGFREETNLILRRKRIY
jgi:hypothetical protein